MSRKVGPRRAVIYLRVSSKEQVENYSLDTQERGCREWCARHGFEVAAVFREEGETGKSTERRVALQAMLRFVARHGADVASGPEVVAQLRADGFRVALESLHRLISNPLYRGRVVADRWGLDVAGRHKPLVDDETFRRAQRLRRFGRDVDAPRAYVTGSTERFPFRAVTRCDGCDAPLTAYRVKARFDYYRCARCRTLAPAAALEAGFLRLLESMAVKPSVIDLAAELAAERAGVLETHGAELATAARRRAATARQRLDRLRRAYLDDQAFDAETFKAEQVRLTGELQDAESAAAAPNPLARIKPRLEAIRHWLQTPVLLWDAVPASRRAALVRRAFPAGLRWDHSAKNLTATKSLLFLPLTPSDSARNGMWYPQDGDSQTADLALPAWLTEFEGLLLEVAPCVSGSSPFSSLPC